MNLKKYLMVSMAACTAVVALTAFSPLASAEEATAAATETASTPLPQGYTYTSKRYGYTIVCPQKPNGVIPLSTMDEHAKGDVLIFANDGYNIQYGWIIMVNAFADAEIPNNLGTMSEDDQKTFLQHIMNTSGYEFARIADINGNKGVYAVTGKEIEIDTNGDGKPDETATADTQMIKTFFRGQYGGHFAVELIENPDLTKEGVQKYQTGIVTFRELSPEEVQPTTKDNKDAAEIKADKTAASAQPQVKKTDKKSKK